MRRIKRPAAVRHRPVQRPRYINYDLTDRDVADNLWLWRHRQPSQESVVRGRRAGAVSQVEAAEILGLKPDQYINLERGQAILVTATDLDTIAARGDCWNEVVDPTIAEQCALARRRAGLPIKDIATQLGVSAQAYTKDEEHGADYVVQFWQSQGFRFGAVAQQAA